MKRVTLRVLSFSGCGLPSLFFHFQSHRGARSTVRCFFKIVISKKVTSAIIALLAVETTLEPSLERGACMCLCVCICVFVY